MSFADEYTGPGLGSNKNVTGVKLVNGNPTTER